MAIFKYAKVLVLAPAIGSALIGVAGLVFGVALIIGRDHLENRTAGLNSLSFRLVPKSFHAQSSPDSTQRNRLAEGRLKPKVATQRSTAGEFSRIANTSSKRTEARIRFERKIESNDLTFLKGYSEQMTLDTDGRRQVKTLISKVAPYTPYHFGIDFPLPQVIEVVMLSVPDPVEIREGRYMMISGRRCLNGCRGRGFLWIDMQTGIALGGVLYYPSNGEPSPTLTIFSKQLDRRLVKMSQLPPAFTEDLSRWAARSGIPPITTRYFIGASGEKFVLPHDEDYCVRSASVSTPSPKGICDQMNARAALIDTTAAKFMEQTHNASNATSRMIASTGQVE